MHQMITLLDSVSANQGSYDKVIGQFKQQQKKINARKPHQRNVFLKYLTEKLGDPTLEQTHISGHSAFFWFYFLRVLQDLLCSKGDKIVHFVPNNTRDYFQENLLTLPGSKRLTTIGKVGMGYKHKIKQLYPITVLLEKNELYFCCQIGAAFFFLHLYCIQS